MPQHPFGRTTAADAASAIPTRRVLLGRCHQCHRRRAYFVVDRSHTSSTDDALSHGHWSPLEVAESACVACREFSPPSMASMVRALRIAHDKGAESVVGPRPRLPRSRRHASPDEIDRYERKVKDFEAEKARYLAEPSAFESWLSAHLDEGTLPAAAQVDV